MLNQYVLILVWIGFMAMLQPSFYRREYDQISDSYVRRVKPLFAFAVMVPIIWMAANRKYVGDSYLYANTFLGMPNSFADIPLYVETLTKDAGYYTFVALLKQLIGNSVFRYFLAMALLFALVLITVYKKYSVNYVLSIFLFVASTDYISWMFNGMRQFTAVVIIFLASKFIFEKKYVLIIAIVLFASLFHQSALIMIPFIIAVQGKAWNKKTVFILLCAVLVVFFVGKFTTLLDAGLSETQYKNVVSDYTSFEDDGTNPLRVLVYSMPAIISFIYRKKIEQFDSKIINTCVNMAIVTMGIYLVSMVTSGIFIGRIPIYCSLYNYILLPWEVEYLFGGNRKIIRIMMIVAYLIFYYYQMHVQYGLF